MSPSIPRKAKSTLGESHPQLMEVVLDELRQLILDFELPPGAHLVEAALADRLGVSRNPVREAIRTLAAESFVEISPRRGAFVATLTPADAKHIFEVRLALEPLGADSPLPTAPKLKCSNSKNRSGGPVTRWLSVN